MLGWTIKKSQLGTKQYNTSGRRSFINRYTDTGFKTKWCGIWTPPIKAFEYFAYKVNGTWLSVKNSCKCTIKPWGVKHYFIAHDLNITESVFAPDNYPSVISVITIKNKAMSRKKVNLEIEAAVNIRTKYENVHDRIYKEGFNELRKSVIIESDIGCCMYGAGKTRKNITIANNASPTYKSHNPGTPQRCFIPGVYTISFSLDMGEEIKIPIVYTAAAKDKNALIDTYDKCAQNWDHLIASKIKRCIEIYHNHDINTPNSRMDKTFLWAQYSLEGLINEQEWGMGMFAGYPWFLEYWGRDIFWSLLGLIDMGRFREAKEMILTMAKYQDKRMPCIVHPDRKKEYHGADIDPLFLIALDQYEKKSGDVGLRKDLKKTIKRVLKNLELMNYITVHESGDTWMDSIKRPGSAVEIQAMWVEALKPVEPKLSMKMNKRLNQNFWNAHKETYYDTYSKLPGSEVTANGLIPLFFGLTPAVKTGHVLKRAKRELLSIYGIRTRSKASKNYSSSGYHTGSCWGLTTGWGAAAFLRYNMVHEGLNCLDALSYDCEKFQPGALSEIVDSETGNLLGAPDQAWSSSLFIYAVDNFLFGIRPEMQKKHITIEPKIPESWGHMYRFGKNIADSTFDLKIERTAEGLEIRMDFHEKPKMLTCELIMPEWVANVVYKQKKRKSRKISFVPEKENVLVGLGK